MERKRSPRNTQHLAYLKRPNTRRSMLNDKPKYTSESKSISMRQPLFNLEAYARYQQGNAQADYGDAVLAAKTHDLYVRLFSAYAEIGRAHV